MANSKKKQEEEHLKLLREMVALPHNKQCFDCHQRGPTYLNMTIGSFVCTSCSGLLRGLNPPHRVKSISMASFSVDEMEFIKCRGNDFCRKVWLNRYDSQLAPEFNVRDELRMREMMSQRYDKRRWYVEPTEAMFEEARQQNLTSAVARASATAKPLTLLVGGNVAPLNVQPDMLATSPPAANQTPQPLQRPATRHSNVPTSTRPPVQQPQPVTLPSPRSPPIIAKPAAVDLLADIGSSPATANQQPSQNAADTYGFQNFAAFTAQSATVPPILRPPGGAPASLPPSAGAQPASFTSSQPADKYSTIADLESVFSSTSIGSGFGYQSVAASVNWPGGATVLGGPGGAMVGGPVAGGGGVWGPSQTVNMGQPVNMGQQSGPPMQMYGASSVANSAAVPPSYSAVAAAPNQFSTPAMVSSSGAMQFISQQQPVNYPPTAAGATVPQQYVPAGYGFYAPQPQMHPGAAPVHPVAAPMPAGFSVYASSQQKQQFVNGASAANTGSGSSSAGTHVAPLAAAGSWPSQTQQQVVNPFLTSPPAAKGAAVGTNPFL